MNWFTGELRQEKSQHREAMGPCGQEQEREKHEAEGGGRGGGEKEPLRSAEPFSWFGCMV